MATECDVNNSRRFNRGMSRRTRRPTSLAACYQDQYVPPLARQLRQDAKLKALFQCQDTEPQALQQCEDAEQQTQAPQHSEGVEQKAPKQYRDEELEKRLQQYRDEELEKKSQQYRDEGQEQKPEQYQDEEQKIREQYQDEEEKAAQQYQEKEKTPEQYQDEEQKPPEQDQDEEHKTPDQYQDEEQKTAKQCQEDEKASEHYQDEEQKAQLECQDTDQKALERRQRVKKPITQPSIDDVPRLSLLELIQEKQLVTGEAKATSKFSYAENVPADRRAPGAAAATGGTTLAMVIRRSDGAKKPTGIIRRCVKALNQMIKAKHESKKNVPFKEV